METLIRVFISYAHESNLFKEQINHLSTWLNTSAKGKLIVESDYKYTYKAPPKGWQTWMEDQLEESHIVLVVCTPKYLSRFRKREQKGFGRGAIFEGAIITQELYDSQCVNEKFVPIIPDEGSELDIPNILKPFFTYLSFPSKNDKILKCILNEKPAEVDFAELSKSFETKPSNAEKTKVEKQAHFSGHYSSLIQQLITKVRSGITDIQLSDRILSLLEVLTVYNYTTKNQVAQINYDNIVFDKDMNSRGLVKNLIDRAAICVEELEFDKAHKLFKKAIEKVSPSDNVYDFLYKEYLITGLICFSRKNSISGLKSLLHTKSKITIDQNSDIGYIVSMIYQEIFTRDVDLRGLSEAVITLTTMYKTSKNPIKSAMANSLGLAYRRLGERTGVKDLQNAIDVLKEGLELNRGDEIMQIELKDQLAITYIRIFEFNHDEVNLYDAEEALKECLELLKKPMHPRYYRLKPL